MRTIAIGVLGLVLVHGGVAAQTPAEQSRILSEFQQNVAGYAERHHGLDAFPEAEGARAPVSRIFTLPVAMVFRQLIAGAIADGPATTAMRGTNVPHHAVVYEPFPATELVDFPPKLRAALPLLPEGLDYRLIGNDLVIRDANADLIIAVLRDAVGASAAVKR